MRHTLLGNRIFCCCIAYALLFSLCLKKTPVQVINHYTHTTLRQVTSKMPSTEKKAELQARLQAEGELTTLAEGSARKKIGLGIAAGTSALYYCFQASLSPVLYSTLVGIGFFLVGTGFFRV